MSRRRGASRPLIAEVRLEEITTEDKTGSENCLPCKYILYLLLRYSLSFASSWEQEEVKMSYLGFTTLYLTIAL